jgi:hypothetical protein
MAVTLRLIVMRIKNKICGIKFSKSQASTFIGDQPNRTIKEATIVVIIIFSQSKKLTVGLDNNFSAGVGAGTALQIG